MRIPRKKIKETLNLIEESKSIKYIHYRKLYQFIDHTNFHIATKVDYTKFTKKNKGILKLWEQIKRENKIILSYKSTSGSKYLITEEGDVYRLSDHWGAIASCEWTLEGEGCLKQSVFLIGPLSIGVVNLSEFKIFLRKIPRKRDIIINPDWQQKLKSCEFLAKKLHDIIKCEKFKSRPLRDKKLVGESFGLINSILKKNYQ